MDPANERRAVAIEGDAKLRAGSDRFDAAARGARAMKPHLEGKAAGAAFERDEGERVKVSAGFARNNVM